MGGAKKKKSEAVFMATKRGKKARKKLTSLVIKDIKDSMTSEGRSVAQNNGQWADQNDSEEDSSLYRLIRGVPTGMILRGGKTKVDFVPIRNKSNSEEETTKPMSEDEWDDLISNSNAQDAILPDVFLVTLLFGARRVVVSATPGTSVRTLREMAAGIAEVHPELIHLFMDDAILRLERNLSFYLEGLSTQNVSIRVGSARGFQLQGNSLPEPIGHASWQSAISPPGSSVHSDPEVESFSLSLVFPDGRVLVQPTWPTITVQLLRRQVATTLQLSHDTVFFVCHGVVPDLERRLSE
jgi:hypothetical protein